MRKMRKAVCLLCAAVLVLPLLLLAGCFSGEDAPEESARVLRVHIRADSNDAADQDVKYLVKEELVRRLMPVLAECADKAAAERAVRASLKDIEAWSCGVLRENGFSYAASARLAREFFPARSYDGVTLPEGEYDALIVDLGEGKGDNWWCMVYPPMCFTGGEVTDGGAVVYKSKILEIINQFKKKYIDR